MKTIPQTAMILAAGRGQRMRPISDKTPKPLISVQGHTLIDYSLDHLVAAGVKRVVVNIHYLGDLIASHLKQRKEPEIILSREDELLDTGGGLVNALPHLGDAPFFILNTDSLWLDGPTPALQRLAAGYDEDSMDALLLLHSTVEAYGYAGSGDFVVSPTGRLVRRPEREQSPYAYMGIQIAHPRMFADAPSGAFSLNVLFDRSLEAERLYGIIHDGEWFHIGTPDGLDQAESYMAERFPGIRHR